MVLLILLSALNDPVQYRYHLTSSELGTDVDVMDDASECADGFPFALADMFESSVFRHRRGSAKVGSVRGCLILSQNAALSGDGAESPLCFRVLTPPADIIVIVTARSD